MVTRRKEADMQDAPEPADGTAPLKLLRWLVTVLTLVMIAGFVVLIALLVTRFPAAPPAELALPETLALPEGARPAAFTRGRGWVAIVTEDDRILIYDAETGALRQSVQVTPAP
jgi:hypothetical protein